MENSYRRHSLIPSFLYSSPLSSSSSSFASKTQITADSNSSSPANNSFTIPAPSEPGKIQMHSPQYYAACTAGGILSCGLTHMSVTPLDLVKCNMQVRIEFLDLCAFILCIFHFPLLRSIIHLLDQICYAQFSLEIYPHPFCFRILLLLLIVVDVDLCLAYLCCPHIVFC